MSKVKMFHASGFLGSLYFLYDHYEKWVIDNPVKVISTLYDNGTLVVTYEEI